MPKKRGSTKKKATKSRTPKTKTSSDNRIEKVLIENFVSLQKVMTNLSVKFDNLANQISKLLELFEISAKTLAKKDFGLDEGKGKITEKIDNLLEQNKIIARGITLLHEPTYKEEYYPPPVRPIQQSPQIMPRPSLQQPRASFRQEGGVEGYQKSIKLKKSPDFLPKSNNQSEELSKKTQDTENFEM